MRPYFDSRLRTSRRLQAALRHLRAGRADHATRAADGVRTLEPTDMVAFGELMRIATAGGQVSVASKLFARHVASLETSIWSPILVGFLATLRDPGVARSLRRDLRAYVEDGVPGAIAVDACLTIPARADWSERRRALCAVQTQCPKMLEAPLVRAACAALPQDDLLETGTPAQSVRAVEEATAGRFLAVLSPQTELTQLAKILPEGTSIKVCSYRPTDDSITKWMRQAAQPPALIQATVCNSFESASDLNNAVHQALSGIADAVACDALAEKVFRGVSEHGAFIHWATAELALSDKIFSWFRTQHAFVKLLDDLDPTALLLVAPTVEVRDSVRAVLKRRQTSVRLLIMEEAATLSSLRRRDRPTRDPAKISVSRPEGDMVEMAESLIAPYQHLPCKGVLASVGRRLYEPAAAQLHSVLGEKTVDLSGMMAATVGKVRFSAVVDASAAQAWGGADRGRLAQVLGMEASEISVQLARIVSRFVSVDLPHLMLIDEATRLAVRCLKPRFGVVMPTRHPPLQIMARNLREAGAVVHEPQVVYFSEMPRYRAPVVDYFHALDTYSAQQVQGLFDLPAKAIRVGGSLRRAEATPNDRVVAADGVLRVVLASQPEPWCGAEERLSALVAALKRLRRPWRLSLRPHPADGALRLEAYKGAAAKVGVALNFGGYLKETDLLVAGFSNLVLEAAVTDIRTIVYWRNACSPPVPYAHMGLALQVSSVEGLADTLQACAEDAPVAMALDASRRRYLAENPFLTSGAAAAMAAFIEAREL